MLTSVVWVRYPHIKEGVLPLTPEATSSDVQTCAVVEVGRFAIPLLVYDRLKCWFCLNVVGNDLQKIVVSVAYIVVASINKSTEMAIESVSDGEGLATFQVILSGGISERQDGIQDHLIPYLFASVVLKNLNLQYLKKFRS